MMNSISFRREKEPRYISRCGLGRVDKPYCYINVSSEHWCALPRTSDAEKYITLAVYVVVVHEI